MSNTDELDRGKKLGEIHFRLPEYQHVQKQSDVFNLPKLVWNAVIYSALQSDKTLWQQHL